MGLYDRIEFDESVFDLEPGRGEWQTKNLQNQPAMSRFRVDEHGHLHQEITETEVVPEEERPKYDEDIGGFREEFHEHMGMFREHHEGWERLEDYHGRFEFYGTVDDEFRRFQATFTHGELESIDDLE